MKKIHFCLLTILFPIFAAAQTGHVNFIGHNLYNDQPINNTTITVLQDDKQIDQFSTGKFPDFKLTLPFGSVYKIYFENFRSQKMFLEVITSPVPKDNKYKMTYELDIPLFPKHATNLDTTQFKYPFHKIVFDGKSRMVDDSVYMNEFLKKVYLVKKEKETTAVAVKTTQWTNLAGKMVYGDASKTPVINKRVNLLNAEGKVIKTATTTKLGSFVFTGVDINQVAKIEADFGNEFTNQNVSVELINTSQEVLGNNTVANNKVYWPNSTQKNIIQKLVDTKYAYKISGRLIDEGSGKNSFYSGKTVLLLNDKNTVVKRAITNVFGSFVFTNVKPGLVYLIGVDKNETTAQSKINLYSISDKYLAPVDSVVPGRFVRRFLSENNLLFGDLLIDDNQLRMNVSGRLFADNINNPIADLKILLLNDKFETLDTTTTDKLGQFMFKYVPFNPQFSISSNNKESILEAINNILVYNSKDEMVKIVSMIRGKPFNYKNLSAEQSQITDVYADDPWLNLMGMGKKQKTNTGEIVVENIFFESNKAELLPQAKRSLDKIALVLNTNITLKIELGAHTDSQGNDAANQKLSEQRAKAACDYIISKGIEPSRIISKGFGETKILNHCKNGVFCPDDEHGLNRRIEFKILGL